MKKYESDNWHARHRSGSGEMYFHSIPITLEDVRAEIDASRKRQAERGYKPDQYIITHEEVYKWYDDDGNFVKKETYESAIETYPTLNA